MYLGVNSLRFHSKTIPMGIMSRGGICLPVTPELTVGEIGEFSKMT